MHFFDGVEIRFGHGVPECRAWVDKVFQDYWVLDYADEGALSYAVGDGPLEVIEAPVAWTTYPGPRFRFGNPPDGPARQWEHRFVAFSGPRVTEYTERGLLPVTTDTSPVAIADRVRFRAAFDELLHAMADGVATESRRVHLLEGLLLQLHEQDRKWVELSATGRRVQTLLHAVESAPGEAWDFKQEADKLHLSYHHLRRIWRQLSGHAPWTFLLNRRIRQACWLLRDPAVTVKEVAWQCGFGDFSYFNRLFRQRTGMTPGQFRRQWPL